MLLARRGGVSSSAKIAVCFLFVGVLLSSFGVAGVQGFRPAVWTSSCVYARFISSVSSMHSSIPLSSRTSHNNSTRGDFDAVRRASPEKAMDFLKRIGKGTGWSSYNGMGIDEGSEATSGTRVTLKKVSDAYASCIDTGIIDDMSELFPTTSCGSGWGKFTYVSLFMPGSRSVRWHLSWYNLYIVCRIQRSSHGRNFRGHTHPRSRPGAKCQCLARNGALGEQWWFHSNGH
jgi:hypothetical protein